MYLFIKRIHVNVRLFFRALYDRVVIALAGLSAYGPDKFIHIHGIATLALREDKLVIIYLVAILPAQICLHDIAAFHELLQLLCISDLRVYIVISSTNLRFKETISSYPEPVSSVLNILD